MHNLGPLHACMLPSFDSSKYQISKCDPERANILCQLYRSRLFPTAKHSRLNVCTRNATHNTAPPRGNRNELSFESETLIQLETCPKKKNRLVKCGRSEQIVSVSIKQNPSSLFLFQFGKLRCQNTRACN